jgi:hypothetical protein
MDWLIFHLLLPPVSRFTIRHLEIQLSRCLLISVFAIMGSFLLYSYPSKSEPSQKVPSQPTKAIIDSYQPQSQRRCKPQLGKNGEYTRIKRPDMVTMHNTSDPRQYVLGGEWAFLL